MDEFNLKDLIDEINAVLDNTLIRLNLGDSRMRRRTRVVLDGSSFRIEFPEYAHFVDSGRRPNAPPPPIKPILSFIRRKGITPRNITEAQLAFAISKAIGRNGIQSRPFLDRLHKEVHELIKIHIFEEQRRILTEFLN